MKKYFVIITLLILTSCSSSDLGKVYYQLPLMIQVNEHNTTVKDKHRLLWVEQVTVSDYLSGDGIVYQTSDVQYHIANNNLWASPLSQQLYNILIAIMNNQLLDWIVVSTPFNNEYDTLNVNITGFHGRYDGKIIISGEWLLNYRGQLTKHLFYLDLKQRCDGYAGMVKTLAYGWTQEVSNIVKEISNLS